MWMKLIPGVRPEFRRRGNFGRFRYKFRSAIVDEFDGAELMMKMKPKVKHKKMVLKSSVILLNFSEPMSNSQIVL